VSVEAVNALNGVEGSNDAMSEAGTDTDGITDFREEGTG
jgi:hypothetical protein